MSIIRVNSAEKTYEDTLNEAERFSDPHVVAARVLATALVLASERVAHVLSVKR